MEKENLINSLVFNLQFPNLKEKEKCMADLETFVEEQCCPCIDDAVSRMGALHNADIENITIDLGKVCLEDLPDALSKALEEAVMRHLDRAMENGNEDAFETMGTPNFPTDALQPLQRNAVWETSDAHFAAVMQYLQKGDAPWQLELSDFHPDEELNHVFSVLKEDPLQLRLFLSKITADDLAFSRFKRLVTEKQLRALCVELLQSDDVGGRQKSGAPSDAETDKIALRHLVEVGDKPALAAVLHAFSKADQPDFQKIIEENQRNDSPDVLSGFGNEMTPRTRGIPIDDAGLVLLHPFLPVLYSRLGLLDEENHFKGMAEREKAVHLLRFASGREGRHFDHLMNLEKLFCGLPLQYPVEPDFLISEQEKLEINDLLASVCQHWKPLNGTSVAGFQQTFLKRNGLVFRDDDGAWIIRVESMAADILMDDLPWEISTILLPWTDDLFVVDWQRNY